MLNNFAFLWVLLDTFWKIEFDRIVLFNIFLMHKWHSPMILFFCSLFNLILFPKLKFHQSGSHPSVFLFFCFLFRAITPAYGHSQTRGSIGATAAGLHKILNPLNKTRDPTRNLMVPSRVCFCCAMTGTPGSHPSYKSFMKELHKVGLILLLVIDGKLYTDYTFFFLQDLTKHAYKIYI